MAQSFFLRMGLFLQRTKITATAVTMIMTAANTAPTAAPTGDPAPLIEPVLLTAPVLVAELLTALGVLLLAVL